MFLKFVLSRVIHFLRFSAHRLFAGIVVLICMANCSAGGFCLKAKADDVRKQLVSQLKPGDARKMADVALRDVGANFSYDEFQNRYQAIIRDAGCGPDEAILIFVSFDKQGLVSAIEVSESYTYP